MFTTGINHNKKKFIVTDLHLTAVGCPHLACSFFFCRTQEQSDRLYRYVTLLWRNAAAGVECLPIR